MRCSAISWNAGTSASRSPPDRRSGSAPVVYSHSEVWSGIMMMKYVSTSLLGSSTDSHICLCKYLSWERGKDHCHRHTDINPGFLFFFFFSSPNPQCFGRYCDTEKSREKLQKLRMIWALCVCVCVFVWVSECELGIDLVWSILPNGTHLLGRMWIKAKKIGGGGDRGAGEIMF